jgi:hypothetical protein
MQAVSLQSFARALDVLSPRKRMVDRQIIKGFMSATINVQSAHNFACGANCG